MFIYTPLFHRRRGGSKGCVGCRGPAFGDILCHKYLSAPPALASEEYEHVGFGPKCGVFSLPGLCAGVTPCLAILCAWLLAARLCGESLWSWGCLR